MIAPRALALSTLTLLAACQAAPPPLQLFAIEIVTLDDGGEPLPGVAVEVEGKPMGATGAAGRLTLQHRAREGTRAAIALRAPDGWRPASVPSSILLSRLSASDDPAAALPIRVTGRWTPLNRSYAVLVDVGAANLPVRAFGVEKAITDGEGVAAFVYSGAPGDELRVEVSSEGNPKLKARTLTQTFVLPPRSEAFLVQGRFAPKREAPPRPAVRRAPRPRLPRAL